MERTILVPNKFLYNKSIPMPNVLIQTSPFAVGQIKLKNKGVIKHEFENCTLHIYGKLYEEDRGTISALLELSHGSSNPFHFHIRDIAKLKGLKNPYDPNIQRPIRESIDRLLDSAVKIRPKKGKKSHTVHFVFLIGSIDPEGYGKVSVSPFLKEIIEHPTTYIQLDNYFNFKSQIARSLYCFLKSQESFTKGNGYYCNLAKLCDFINYRCMYKYWGPVWQQIEAALKELKNQNFVGSWKKEKSKNNKINGPTITVWKALKDKSNIKEITSEFKHLELINKIKKEIQDKGINWDDTWNKALDKRLEELDGYLNETGLDQNWNCICTYWDLNGFINTYTDHLHKYGFRFFNPALFKYNGKQIQSFIQEMISKGNMTDPGKLKQNLSKKHSHKNIIYNEKIDRCLCGQVFGHDFYKNPSKEENLDICEECKLENKDGFEQCKKMAEKIHKTAYILDES